MSYYERALSGFPKGLKKCGSKIVKDAKGNEVNPEKISVVKMMSRVILKGDGD